MSKLLFLGALGAVLMTGTALAQSAPKVEVLHWLTAGAESPLAQGVDRNHLMGHFKLPSRRFRNRTFAGWQRSPIDFNA